MPKSQAQIQYERLLRGLVKAAIENDRIEDFIKALEQVASELKQRNPRL